MKPTVPAVPLTVWQALYTAAQVFAADRPWEILDDRDLIGVRDPATGETGFGVVMGSGGTVFGFCLYRGAEGFGTYVQAMEGRIDVQEDEAFAMQNFLDVEFGPRSELQPQDLAVIRGLGLSFKGNRDWPQFRSLLPGYAPWFLTESEARFLAFALRTACHHCGRVRSGEAGESIRTGECLVYSLDVSHPLQPEASWEPWPLVSSKPIPLPVADVARIRAMLTKKLRPDAAWEADLIYLPNTIHDRDRPYFTRLALVCQRLSGLAFAADVILPETTSAQALAGAISSSVERSGFLPREVFVKRREDVAALAPLAKELGLRIRHGKELAAVRELKQDFMQHLGYGAKRGKTKKSGSSRSLVRTDNGPIGLAIYQIKVSLKGSQPLIWRRFLAPAQYTLEKLHRVLQTVLGWENAHLHEFKVGGLSYGQPDPEFGDRMLSHRKVTIQEVAPRAGNRLTYIYDFGDGWQHELKVEKILDAREGEHYPVCIAGERACPPEDCGGIGGFAELLEAIRNPETDEQHELAQWAGDYDPSAFDLEAVNRRLRRMK